MTTRNLRTTAFASREELADAMQNVFVAEVLRPSRPLWLVTPWISDVPLVDNRPGRFVGLLPGLPRRVLRLGELLEHQLIRGGSVVVACRPDTHNAAFTATLTRRAEELGVEASLRTLFSDELHEKGILTDRLLLSGSMNLTYNGLRRLEESIHLTNSGDAVARTRIEYQDRWGAP